MIYEDLVVENYQWRDGTADEFQQGQETSTDDIIVDKNIPSFSTYWILGWSSFLLVIFVPWKKHLTHD